MSEVTHLLRIDVSLRWRVARIWLCAGVALFGCRDAAPTSDAPAAQATRAFSGRADIAAEMRTAAAAPRGTADGGGRAWIEEGPATVTAGAFGSWRFVYEVGGEGIADGGRIIFMTSPFWGWSVPQDRSAEAPGYVTVQSAATGMTLTPEISGSPLMGIAVGGRALTAGERITVAYGGAVGARTDRFAEVRSHFWFGVDGDGDGTHRFLTDSPAVAVEAAQPRTLVAIAPSTVRPGGELALRISLLDGNGNAGFPFVGELALTSEPPGLELPTGVRIEPADRGTIAVRLRAPSDGVFRVRVAGADDFTATTNPIVVTSPDAPLILWGDLHGHSELSDGTGSAADYFRFARDVAGLDVVSLTDHDHWGVLHLDANPALWAEIRAQAEAFHDPGRFVTLQGYEWTSWEHGHRHVLFFEDDAVLYSSIDPRYDHPRELWDALRGRDAITVAHHSAGGPIAIDWSIAPDPAFEPVTEVVSVHGVSEAADSPGVIYDPVPGNFVRDALGRGYRFGFVGSGDSHDGHPGLAHISSGGTGGLAAIIAPDLSRTAVLEALRQRRVYATSGPRIYLRVALSTHPMGSIVKRVELAAAGEAPSLYVHVIGTDTIDYLDIVRSGMPVRRRVAAPQLEVVIPIDDPQPGEYVYVRVVQADGGLAWSSPIFIE